MKRVQLACLIFVAAAALGALPSESCRAIWQGREVEYQPREGWALVETDILLFPLDRDNAPAKDARSAVALADPRFRWPGGVIYYRIDPALASPARVAGAIEHWEANTFFRFVERSTQPNYVTFRPGSGGCSSNLGMIGGQQYINLDASCTLGNTIHEIGHTAGLFHTQSRTDRNRYLRVLYDNISKPYWSQYNQALLDGRDLGPYDFNSVMHYGLTGFTRNNLPAMETVPRGIPLGQRAGLSPLDVQALYRLYEVAIEGVVVATTPSGLKVVVDGAEYAAPVRFDWREGERHTVAVAPLQFQSEHLRNLFVSWSDGGAAEHEITVSAGQRVFDARFRQQTRIRTGVTPAGAGAVTLTGAPEDGFVDLGARVRLSAQANEGWNWVRWFAGQGGVTIQSANGLGIASNPSTLTVLQPNLYYVASFTRAPVTRIESSPPGRSLMIDDASYATPAAFAWTPGSRHTVSSTALQTGPAETTRHYFLAWSNGGERTQIITVPEASSTLRATFETLHQLVRGNNWLVFSSAPTRPSNASLELTPSAIDDYYLPGAQVQVRALSGNGWEFANYYGDLGGNHASHYVTLDGETWVVGNFLSPRLFNASALTSDASRQPDPVSPGAIFALYRPSDVPETPVEGQPGPGGRYPTRLADTTVSFDGVPAQLIRVSRDCIRLIVPAISEEKSRVTVEVEQSGVRSSRPVPAAQIAPAVYTRTFTGRGLAAAWSESGAEISAENPARPGSLIRVRLTGLGPHPTRDLLVEAGGFSGTALALEPSPGEPPGLYDLLLRLPASLEAGAQPFYVGWQGNLSQPGVFLLIASPR